jgi:hypothetical protein
MSQLWHRVDFHGWLPLKADGLEALVSRLTGRNYRPIVEVTARNRAIGRWHVAELFAVRCGGSGEVTRAAMAIPAAAILTTVTPRLGGERALTNEPLYQGSRSSPSRPSTS